MRYFDKINPGNSISVVFCRVGIECISSLSNASVNLNSMINILIVL